MGITKSLAKLKNLIFHKRSSVTTFIQEIMLFYLLVWSVSPPLCVDEIFRIIALGCAVGWMVLSSVNGTLRMDKIHKLALVFVLLIMIIALIEFKMDFSMLVKLISYYMLVLAFIINHSYEKRWNELLPMILFCMLLLIIFNLITFKELMVDSSLARRIAKSDETLYSYMRRGVGGYSLIYTQVILFPVIVLWTIKSFSKHKIYFAFGAVWIVSYLMFIMKAGYSIAIVTSVISLIILAFYRRKSFIPALFVSLAVVVLLVWLIGYVEPVREFLLRLFNGTTIAKKINDIYNSIHGAETADSIESRIIRYLASLRTIVRYPLIGSLWFDSGGGHSMILDTFAKYGVWGGLLYVNMLYCVPIYIKKNITDIRDHRIANSLIVSLVMVTVLDSVSYEMIFPILIMIPVLLSEIYSWRTKADALSAGQEG